VQPHAHTGLSELLQRVGDLDLLTPEPRLLGHDEDPEGWPRLEGRHEGHEAGPGRELGAGYRIVHEHELVSDGPSLALGIEYLVDKTMQLTALRVAVDAKTSVCHGAG
jgi:hypothetical protein